MRIKLSLLVAIAALSSACGGSIADKATKSISTALVATDAARDQFASWDKQHQLDIVDKASTKEGAVSALQEYRDKRQKIVQAFTVAYASMGAASVLVPLVQAGKAKDAELMALLIDSIAAVKSVMAAVEEIRGAFDSDSPVDDPVPEVPEPVPAVPAAPEPAALPDAALRNADA